MKKLGFLIDVTNSRLDLIASSTPAVIKVHHSVDLFSKLYNNLAPKGTIFIYRPAAADLNYMTFWAGDAKSTANKWYNTVKQYLDQLPKGILVEGFNEPYTKDNTWLARYSDFESERIKILADNGFKACIGNFSVGEPEIVDPVSQWPLLLGMLKTAHEYNAVLGLHEYAEPSVGFINSSPWMFGRHRLVWDKYIKPNGFTNIRIILTELALTYWKNTLTDDQYIDQLAQADNFISQTDYVLGATIFLFGTANPSMWGAYDITGKVGEELCRRIKPDKKENDDMRLITTSVLNLREFPTTNSRVLAKIPSNTVLECATKDSIAKFRIEQGKVDLSRFYWVEVEYNGIYGFVATRWLNIV